MGTLRRAAVVCMETRAARTSAEFCAAAAAAEARGAGLQGSACPHVTRAQRGPQGTSGSRRLRRGRESAGPARRGHLGSASVGGANPAGDAAFCRRPRGRPARSGRIQKPGVFLRAFTLHLRCRKTGTPHRGGKEVPRSPGVLGLTKKRRMSSVRAPGPLSPTDDGVGGRAPTSARYTTVASREITSLLCRYLKDPDWKRKGNM